MSPARAPGLAQAPLPSPGPAAVPTRRVLLRGQWYALAAIAIWSTNFAIGRLLRDSVTPGTIAAARAAVAGVPLAAWLLLTQPRPRVGRRVVGWLVVLGVLGIFASQYLTYLALHWSLATNAIILNAASPLVTAGLAAAAGLFVVSRALFLGLTVSAVGAAVVTWLGASAGEEMRLDPGAIFIIASMVTWAFYNLGVQRISGDLPPLWITAGAMLAGFPFLVAAIAVERPPHLMASVRDNLLILIYLGIGPSAIAYACWNAAVRDLGAGVAMMFNNLLPIFGMLLGGLVLHERITGVQVLASGLIIGGIVIAYRALPGRSQTGSR
ncbi:MAG TPA: DMT family transporter [bacterium]|nr:DMT family transporter [bacterium]